MIPRRCCRVVFIERDQRYGPHYEYEHWWEWRGRKYRHWSRVMGLAESGEFQGPWYALVILLCAAVLFVGMRFA